MNRNTMENNDTLAKLKSLRSQWNLNIWEKSTWKCNFKLRKNILLCETVTSFIYLLVVSEKQQH